MLEYSQPVEDPHEGEPVLGLAGAWSFGRSCAGVHSPALGWGYSPSRVEQGSRHKPELRCAAMFRLAAPAYSYLISRSAPAAWTRGKRPSCCTPSSVRSIT